MMTAGLGEQIQGNKAEAQHQEDWTCGRADFRSGIGSKFAKSWGVGGGRELGWGTGMRRDP